MSYFIVFILIIKYFDNVEMFPVISLIFDFFCTKFLIIICISYSLGYCKDLNNFNSMFAILSGLGSTSVNRLRQTWSRVPNRYRKIFSDLETVMDPSQNMKNYRKLANTSFSQPPMVCLLILNTHNFFFFF